MHTSRKNKRQGSHFFLFTAEPPGPDLHQCPYRSNDKNEATVPGCNKNNINLCLLSIYYVADKGWMIYMCYFT